MSVISREVSTTFQEVSNTSFIALKKKETHDDAPLVPMFSFSGKDHSCLTCFLALRLESGADGQPVVKLLWTYPLAATKVLESYPNLGKFALANAGTSYAADQLSYTFVFTDSHGVRTYGHSTAFVNGEAVVVLSPYPWCNFFYHLAHLYRVNGEQHGKQIVRALVRCPTPPSGAMFATPTTLSVVFTRPYDRLCSFIDSSPLDMLNIFSRTEDLFSILADLLLEKHVIIVGPNFSIVSNVVMSLQALIAPFDWMHILIPILPSSLIDVLAAPPPYLVGTLTSQLPLVYQVPMDRCVIVHLGSDGTCERLEYVQEERHRLPHSGVFSALRVGLSILKLRDPEDQSVHDLCSLFLTYYAGLFGEVALKDGRGFIKDREHMSASSAHFFEKLLSTQSFSALSEEMQKVLEVDGSDWMDNEFVVATVRRHGDVYPAQHAKLMEEERRGGGFLARYEGCFGSREEFTAYTAAVHGFGGHPQTLRRLLVHAMCGRCFGLFGPAPQPVVSSSSGSAGSISVGEAIHRRVYRSAPCDTPVIVDSTEPSMELVEEAPNDEPAAPRP